MGKRYDNNGKFIGYYQGEEDVSKDVTPTSNLTNTANKLEAEQSGSSQEREEEIALRFAVEMKKLELERENSDKNRALVLFVVIIIFAFIAGYLLFK